MEFTAEPETEKVVLATIYKKNGEITIKFSRDSKDYETFGFLQCFVKHMEEVMVAGMEETDGEEEE